MTTIYLVRHGEAEGNLYKRAQGVYNSNLTKHGKSQLSKLVDRFSNINVDKVYASDLKRAYLTAKSIADSKGLDVIKNENFREMNMGIFEDIPWADLPRNHFELWSKWTKEPHKCKLKDGESGAEVQDRMLSEIIKISTENKGKNIVIGTHGTAIRYLLYKLKGVCLSDNNAIDWCDNTAITKLIFDGENFEIEYMNDSKHLDGFLSPFNEKKWFEMSEEELLLGANMWFRDVNDDHEVLNKLCKKEINHSETKFIMLSENIAGVCSADVKNSTGNVGIIDYMALSDEYIGKGFAPQLIGYFVNIYRNMGKEFLSIKTDDKRTIAFCEKIGFEKVDNQYIFDIRV